MKVTVYLPDDLGEKVKAADINVSAVCQEALQEELIRQEALAKLDKGMERIELELGLDGEAVKNAFYGKELAFKEYGSEADATIYLTQRHRIAVFHTWDENATLDVYDDFDAAERQDPESDAGLLAQAAAALGEERVVFLDI